MRSGETSGLKTIEAKALSDSSGPDGGYFAPPNVENDILMRLDAVVDIEQGIAQEVEMSSPTRRAPPS
jgi:HK97 family phage major capsid protein